MTTDRIIPTKKNPVFVAVCEDFGYIETRMWKDWFIANKNGGGNCGTTFAVNYCDAVRYLHEWLIENSEYVMGLKKIKFTIEVIDGSVDKWGDVIRKVVYSIDSKKAQKYVIPNYKK